MSQQSTLPESLRLVPPSLRVFLAGAVFTDFMSGLYRLVLPWWVYDVSHSALAMGLFIMMQYLAGLITPWAGDLLDRWDIRAIVQASGLIQILAIGVVVSFAQHPLPFIDVLGFILAGGTLFTQLSVNKLIQTRVPSAARLALNGLIGTLTTISWNVSPGLAGFFIMTIGIRGTLILNAMGFLAIVIPSFLLPAPQTDHFAIAAQRSPVSGVFDRFVTGFHLWHREKDIVALTLVVAGWYVTWGGVYTMVTYHFRHHFHWSSSEVGLITMTAGIIPVGFGLFGIRLTQKWGVPRLISGALILSGLGMAALALANAPWEAFLALGCMNGAIVPTTMVIDTMTQSRISANVYGRVNALQTLLLLVGQPLAAITEGLLVGRLGTSTSFLIWAGATMALGATVWTTKIKEAKLPPSTD